VIFRRRPRIDPDAAARAAALDRAIAAWQQGAVQSSSDDTELRAAMWLSEAGNAAPAAPHEPIVALRAAIAARTRRGLRNVIARPGARAAIPAFALAAVITMAVAVPQLDSNRTNTAIPRTVDAVVQSIELANKQIEQAASAADSAARTEALEQASKLVERANAQAATLPDDPRDRILESLRTQIVLLQRQVADLQVQIAATSTTTSTTQPPESTTSTSSTTTTSTTRPHTSTTTTSTTPASTTTTTSTPPPTTRPPTTTTTEPSVDASPKSARRP
jgi:hypothetical protein